MILPLDPLIKWLNKIWKHIDHKMIMKKIPRFGFEI